MHKNAFLALVFALILAGCGGGHHDLIPLAKQLDVLANAHDADGFAAAMTDDAIFKGPDGSTHTGKDSIRAALGTMFQGFHVESHGYQQSGDTVSWESTLRSDAVSKTGLGSFKGNAMAVFSGDKVKYFGGKMGDETLAK